MTPVEAARTFLGVPFRHQGRDSRGLDCAGLVIAAWALCGVELPDRKGYGRSPWQDGLREAVEEGFPLKVEDDREPGDVLLFRVRKEPQHVAIVTDRGIIHSYANVGKVVESRLDQFWIDRIVGHYRR